MGKKKGKRKGRKERRKEGREEYVCYTYFLEEIKISFHKEGGQLGLVQVHFHLNKETKNKQTNKERNKIKKQINKFKKGQKIENRNKKITNNNRNCPRISITRFYIFKWKK